MNDPIHNRGKLALFGLIALALALMIASGLIRPVGESAALLGQNTPATRPALQEATALSDAFVAISEAVTPAVVRIQVERPGGGDSARAIPREFRDFFGLPPEGTPDAPQFAGGTGFIVSSDGHILTNNHVVDGADRITVTLLDRRSFDARIVGRDRTTDIAVIKVEAGGLPTVRLGNSDQTRVGEWVVAIGNPGFGDASTLDFTVTSGIISAKGRPLQIIPQELQAHGDAATAVYAIEDFLQTDAVINPGNSGGPLLNLKGEVIGINTAIASGSGYYQGYGFAIPSNLARRVLNDLLKHGQVRRALLGISITDVTPEDAELYRLPTIAGVLIEDFAADSPGRKAGLERGDVIVEVDGQRVERVGQLQRLIAQHQPGEAVAVGAIRFGDARRFQVELVQAPFPTDPTPPSSPPARPQSANLGLELAELTPALARQIGYARAGGVVVTGVAPASPAARKLVPRGYRIVSIDQKAVSSPREAEQLLGRARAGSITSLLLEGPDGRTRIVNLRVP